MRNLELELVVLENFLDYLRPTSVKVRLRLIKIYQLRLRVLRKTFIVGILREADPLALFVLLLLLEQETPNLRLPG